MAAAKTRGSPVAISIALNASCDRQYDLYRSLQLFLLLTVLTLFLHFSSDPVWDSELGFCTFYRLYNNCTI